MAAAASELSRFLDDADRRQWQLGTWDCTMAMADWVKVRTGRDPAARWRGQYHDRQTRRALLRRERGGVGDLLERGLAWLELTNEPREGDVGLIRIKIGRGAVAAIALNDGAWWTPSPNGGAIVLMPAAVTALAAWRVP